jgi:hypothetical protein
MELALSMAPRTKTERSGKSYSLPFNSVASIEGPLGVLLGADLKSLVRTVV